LKFVIKKKSPFVLGQERLARFEKRPENEENLPAHRPFSNLVLKTMEGQE
jgi:hypothetical protein